MLAHGRKQRGQVLAQQLQVGLVARAHRHLDVDVAALLGGEVVAAAVEREGGDARLALEDDGAAVALMHVEVHNQDPPDELRVVAKRHEGGHTDVVEDAVALASVGKGVVRAAGKVSRHDCGRRAHLSHRRNRAARGR